MAASDWDNIGSLRIGLSTYTGDEILRKYDQNDDGKLSSSELKNLIADLQSSGFADELDRKRREKEEEKRLAEKQEAQARIAQGLGAGNPGSMNAGATQPASPAVPTILMA